MSNRHHAHKRKANQAQKKAQINRDKARKKLLRQRKKLATRRKANLEASTKRREDGDGDEDRSPNPTAYSTVPPQKSNAQNAVRNGHSTVPPAPKYSTVQARKRLYGQRLHRATAEADADDAGREETVDPGEDG